MKKNEGIDFTEVDQAEGEIELTPPEVYAANLIEWAVDRHASDLFVSDAERSVVVAVRRLGKIETVRRLARDYGHKLQGHLRVIASADSGETFRPTEGRGVAVTPSGDMIDLRLSSMPTLFGQDVAVRLFHPTNGARSIDRLGLDDYECKLYRELVERPSGLILVTGPVASGTSSTLYAAIDHLNDGTRKIHTLEDPIEHTLPGVMQSQVNLKAGVDYSDLLSAVLRHSPDVIMIGEIRDSNTASAAVRAGASGQLVLATLHAKSSAEAIDAMLRYGANSKFLASSLIGVVNQRLIRQLCPSCRVKLDTDRDLPIPPRVQERLEGEEGLGLYGPGGCDECYGDGFTSLAALPEIMAVDRELADEIAAELSTIELQDRASQRGMSTLAETAMTRVFRGNTTAYECSRAVADPDLAALVAIARDAVKES